MATTALEHEPVVSARGLRALQPAVQRHRGRTLFLHGLDAATRLPLAHPDALA
jgi:hypothetical protein